MQRLCCSRDLVHLTFQTIKCFPVPADWRILSNSIMEQNWTKVDFKNAQQQAVTDDRLRLAQEAMARDLSISLSTFLRGSVTASYLQGGEMLFSDFMKNDAPSCFGLALIRPQQHRLLLQVEYSILFPMIGIALGAKAGRFESPQRKPTEIELQVVKLFFRLLLSEAYRAWAVPLKTQMDTVTLEIERTPGRSFAATDPVFVARFGLTVAEQTGQFSLVAPVSLFAALGAEEITDHVQKPESSSADTTLELMMQANVSLDVWLDGSHMRLGDLLQLREGQIVKLDHPVERKAVCTLNGKKSFAGQIVSTGTRRAFMTEDFAG